MHHGSTMTKEKFKDLYEGLCDIVQAPRLALGDAVHGSLSFHVNRQGVIVNVLHFPQACADHAFVLFEFGPIPHEDPRAYHILLALLDVNFLLPQPHPPALGRNPANGHVVMRCVYPLAQATPAGLLELIDAGAALAVEWRQNYFLDEASGQDRSAGNLHTPPGTLA